MTTMDTPVVAPSEGMSENASAWLLFVAMIFTGAIVLVAFAGCLGKVGYIAARRAVVFYAALGTVFLLLLGLRSWQ